MEQAQTTPIRTPHDFVYHPKIGMKLFSAWMDKPQPSISRSIASGSFAPKWYWRCRSLAKFRGVECPLILFGFDDPQPPQSKDLQDLIRKV